MHLFVSKKYSTRTARRLLLLAVFAFVLLGSITTTHAATAGFVTKGGYTYYRQTNGSYYKGGFLQVNGKKYYFNKTTGRMFTGWQMVNGQKYRYFNRKTGVMATGYVKDGQGRIRYFNKSNGVLYHGYGVTGTGKVQYFQTGEGYMKKGWMITGSQYRYFDKDGYMLTGAIKTNNNVRYFCTTKPENIKKSIGNYGALYVGLKHIGNYYYYFSPAKTSDPSKVGGIMYTSKAVTLNGKTHYFQANGRAINGWLTLNNKKYYFKSYVLQKNTVITVGGKQYSCDSKGVATPLVMTTSPSGNITVHDPNGRTYTLYSAYQTIPGIANGQIDDVTILAAIADREMGASTLEGMIGVCMAVLNRSLPENTAFPSDFKQCIFQTPWQFSESSDGSFAVFEKRLNGIGWANKTLARKAATTALQMYNDYRTKGTPRKIAGYKTNDFDYIGFMTPDFFRSSLGVGGFDPGKYETYAGICTYFDCWNKAWGNS